MFVIFIHQKSVSHFMKGVLFLINFLLAFSLNAQFDFLRNYNVKQGLPSSDVYSVIQDSKGFIWISGDVGVCRFNGYEFKNFDVSHGLADNTVFGIHEDHKKRVWFSSVSARLSYYSNDSIYRLPCNDTLDQLLSFALINSLYVDKRDTIWMGTTENFLFKISPGRMAKDVQKIVMPDGKYICEIEDQLIYGGNSKGPVKVAVYNKLSRTYSIETGIYNAFNSPLRFTARKLYDKSYLVSVDKDLIHFGDGKILNQKKEASAGIFIHEEKNGSILLSTYQGAFWYDDARFENRHAIQQLNNKVVTSVWVDKENGMWLGTEGQGLYYIPFREFKYYTAQNGLPDSRITCTAAKDSIVISAHATGVISLLYKDTIKIIRPSYDNEPVQTPHIINLFNYKNQLYLNSECNVFKFEDNTLKPIRQYKELSIKKIILGEDSTLWGMKYIRFGKLNSFENPTANDVALKYSKLLNIYQDAKGLMWVCTVRGIFTYDKELHDMSKEDTLYRYRCVDITADKKNNLWFPTKGGGLIIKKGKQLMQITVKDGLPSNFCKKIIIDGDKVWVGTNKGLSCVTLQNNGTYKIENIHAVNGLLTDEVNDIIKKGNELWITHNNGISIFNPDDLKNNTCKPPIHLVSVNINGERFSDTVASHLKHDQNFLSFNYIGLSYKDAGNILYRYKLIGLDTNWLYTKYTQVNYQTVPPGTYEFVVYASNNDGYWSEKPACFYFTVHSPWWLTWPVIASTIILLFLVFFYIVRARLNQLRKRENEKMKLQQRISETELQALRAQMNPHFIFNSINSVQYFMTENDSKSSRKYLAKFAKLIRYVVDNSKPVSIPLKTELEALSLYLELEALRFEEKFEYTIDIDNSVDIDYVQIPSMLIQPYIENAIWHGLMHMEGKGNIYIGLKIEETILKCVVIDNGIGRVRSKEINNNKEKSIRKSLGMSITKERLDIINQINNFELSVEITDVLNEAGQIAGTKVELNIPVN
jgi:ligand-binding sensor domain-containing protein